MKRLLLVDDEPAIRLTFSTILQSRGFAVASVGTVRDALRLIDTQPFDLLLSDLNIGEPGDGFVVVSAMRRIQPDAATFILTGYPDFDTALRAIRSQVDDYFIKPVDPDTLVESLVRRLAAPRSDTSPSPPAKRVSEVLREQLGNIVNRWYEDVRNHPELFFPQLTKSERADHVPELVTELIDRIERPTEDTSEAAVVAAQRHGRARYRQGYQIPQIVLEMRVLQHVLTGILESNLLGIDLSNLIHDVLETGESLNTLLEISIRAYQSEVPTSLQTSFSLLYGSAHLGVAVANEERIVDANNAFLQMVGYTREEMKEGLIDWKAMTPDKYLPLDRNAIEQVREYGASAPLEKEYVLRDGSKLPFIIGAVRLSTEPLQWAAYVLDLSHQHRATAAERQASDLKARAAVISQLAHELNNPLAAMTFTLHILSTHDGLPEDVRKLISDSTEMLERISRTVREVLVLGTNFTPEAGRLN